MFEQILSQIASWTTENSFLAIPACFLWGMVSVIFSPCHIASIPLMIGYVAGQEQQVKTQDALGYALCFSLGLCLSIVSVGCICILLGRMLGDISPLVAIPVGLFFIWLGIDLIGVAKCSLPNKFLSLSSLRGYFGAFVLGIVYGIMSGACTFGFIAPILALITVQQRIVEGLLQIVCFALGHCLPLAVAGTCVVLSRRVIQHKGFDLIAQWGRKFAGVLVAGIGVYFVVSTLILL